MILAPLSKLKLDYTDLTTNIQLLKRVRVLKKSTDDSVKQWAKSCLTRWRKVLASSGPQMAPAGDPDSARSTSAANVSSSKGAVPSKLNPAAAPAAGGLEPKMKKQKTVASATGSGSRGGGSNRAASLPQPAAAAAATLAPAGLQIASPLSPPTAAHLPPKPSISAGAAAAAAGAGSDGGGSSSGGGGSSAAATDDADDDARSSPIKSRTGPPAKAKTPSLHKQVKQSEEFTCPKCTYVNAGGLECLVCGTHYRRPKTVLVKKPTLLNEYINRTPYVPPSILDAGSSLVAMDDEGNWYTAKVNKVAEGKIHISFDGWSEKCDEWISATSTRLREPLHPDVLLEAQAAAAAGGAKRKAVDPEKAAAVRAKKAKRAAEKKAQKAAAAAKPKAVSHGAGTNRLFIVEHVLNHRVVDETLQYYIKWKDYGHEENTWEPSTNLPRDSLAAFKVSEIGMYPPPRFFFHSTKASAQTLKKIAKKFSMTGVDLLNSNRHIPGITLTAKLQVATSILIPEDCVGDLGGERMDAKRDRKGSTASTSSADGGGSIDGTVGTAGDNADGVSFDMLLGESTAALLSPSILKDVFSGIAPTSLTSTQAAVEGAGAAISAGAAQIDGGNSSGGGGSRLAVSPTTAAVLGADVSASVAAAAAAAAVSRNAMDEIDALSRDLLAEMGS